MAKKTKLISLNSELNSESKPESDSKFKVDNTDLSNIASDDKLNKNIDQGGKILMQSDEDNQPDSNAQPASKCGGVLKIAREKNGLSIQDIASRLKISPKQIIAIESDHFEVLPEPTIVRGFIRNYAKLLKLDPEPLLDAYKVIVPEKSPYAFAIKPASSMKVSQYEKPKMGRYIWGGFVVMVGLAAWLFYQNYVQKPNPSTPSQPTETIEQLPQPALPAAERLELNTTPTNSASEPGLSLSPATEMNAAIATPKDSADSTNSADPVNTPPSQAPANTSSQSSLQLTPNVDAGNALANSLPLNADSASAQLSGGAASSSQLNKVIEFNANQETWVSVVDVNGRKIINKTIFANSREKLEVTPPVSVTVGNAAGLSMVVDNKPVDLAPHTRGNIARIKLD